MNIALWIVAGVLAAMFLLAGLMKATQPKEKLAENMAWVNDFSAGTVKFIGVAELLGALGLILPAAFKVATVLTPLAATGLAATMLGATVVHVRRAERGNAVFSGVLFVIAAVLAVLRFGPYSF